MSEEKITATGGCLCGKVHYEVRGPLQPIIACHCQQCQKTSGHFVAATSCDHDYLTIYGEDQITWFSSSDEAKRGFCKNCGGNLFWQNHARNALSIMAGTINKPTNLKITQHIYVEDKSDYYEITDDIPQHATR